MMMKILQLQLIIKITTVIIHITSIQSFSISIPAALHHHHHHHHHHHRGSRTINNQGRRVTTTKKNTLNNISRKMNMINLHSSSDQDLLKKKLILIRHGKTYMNEYLATEGSQWGDANFTDVGLNDYLYKDSQLSPFGVQQAKKLCSKIATGASTIVEEKKYEYCIDDIDLIIVSPLTRTFQTLEYALLPHLKKQTQQQENEHDDNDDDNDDNDDDTKKLSSSSLPWSLSSLEYKVPIISSPLASERVYLKSDLGLPLNELKKKFPYARFENDFEDFEDDWWFTVKEEEDQQQQQQQKSNAKIYNFNSIPISQYKEWRPSTQNQTYSCYGEPDVQFNQRMIELYQWLERRNEKCICMISHWGVLDWLTDGQVDFDNCEWREVDFESVCDSVNRRKMEMVNDNEKEINVVVRDGDEESTR